MQGREKTRKVEKQQAAVNALSANDRHAYDAALAQGLAPDQALRYAQGEMVTFAYGDPNAPKAQQLQVETIFADGSDGYWRPERDTAGYYERKGAAEPAFDRHPRDTAINRALASTKDSMLGSLANLGGRFDHMGDQGGLMGFLGDAGFVGAGVLSVATEIGFPGSEAELAMSVGGGALGMLGKAGKLGSAIEDLAPVARSADDIARTLDQAIVDLRGAYLAGEDVAPYAREIASLSTHTSGSVDRVVLGKWVENGGYIGEAKTNGGIWYETADGVFDKITTGLSPDAGRDLAWSVNEQFLAGQLERGVPRIDFVGETVRDVLINRPTSFSAMEIKYLQNNAAKYSYMLDGNSWIKVGGR